MVNVSLTKEEMKYIWESLHGFMMKRDQDIEFSIFGKLERASGMTTPHFRR